MEKGLLPNEVMLGEVSRLLEEGREVVMKPKGNSMLPFIRGDIDSVALRKPEQLKVGDIALARFNGKYILHRVIALEGDKVTLMGDGNLSGTEKGNRSEVFGIVTEIISPEGLEAVNFNRMISMNASAAFLWKEVEDKDFDTETLVQLLLDNYDITREVAEKDVATLLQSWKEAGVVEE